MIKASNGSIRPEHNISPTTLCPFLSSYGLPSVVSPQPWRDWCRDEYSVHLCGSGEGRHAHTTVHVWRSEDSRVCILPSGLFGNMSLCCSLLLRPTSWPVTSRDFYEWPQKSVSIEFYRHRFDSFFTSQSGKEWRLQWAMKPWHYSECFGVSQGGLVFLVKAWRQFLSRCCDRTPHEGTLGEEFILAQNSKLLASLPGRHSQRR